MRTHPLRRFSSHGSGVKPDGHELLAQEAMGNDGGGGEHRGEHLCGDVFCVSRVREGSLLTRTWIVPGYA